jgi:hypothetical protein
VTSYPTSPPWAPPAQSPAGPAAPAPYTAHGQLLVPYPEEMHNAGRPRPPAVWPVAVFTLIFGLLGAISASRRAAQARRGRTSTAPYWITYVIALVASVALGVVVTNAGVRPLLADRQEASAVSSVQHQLVSDDTLTRTAGVKATKAACTAVGPRGSDGNREYSCLLTFDTGKTGTVDVTADRAGNWTAA